MTEEKLDIAILVRSRFVGKGNQDRVRSLIKKIAGCKSGIPSSDEPVLISACYELLVHHTIPKNPKDLEESCNLIINLDPSNHSATLTYCGDINQETYRTVEEDLQKNGWKVSKNRVNR